ncbi:hypothetical protein [Agrococcus sp. BE272]|uniref:hypothetical protein n=1 Tax=Agrococcus sp. BE272 TaxID=2817727 RepID=UPI002866E6BA|nr:hypothetical protein [Agrococcus sp. BE272]MDR7234335.1 hypothetical protein [Agrococcus sp. BE272]
MTGRHAGGGPDGASMPAVEPGLAFVTVVFEPELPLLRLQARSFRQHLAPDDVAELVVLDNCAGGMGRSAQRAVLDELGEELAARTAFVRTSALGVDGGTKGWRSQQAAKLLVARRLRSEHIVILDAKNHLIGAASAADFVGPDGRVHGATHPYTEHPLRADLERTLRYLGADDARIASLLEAFPPTTTPFVIRTQDARRMLDDVELTSGRPFGEEFERAGLLEFFLYSGWCILRGSGMPVDGEPIRAPLVWPRKADERGAAEAIRDASDSGAAWFAVHRRALARADGATTDRIVAFWVERGLMTAPEARRFVRRFRLGYIPAVGRARAAERLSRLRSR